MQKRGRGKTGHWDKWIFCLTAADGLHDRRPDEQTTLLPQKTVALVTFALCGFANVSSIAIQMAVTGGLAPNQRPVIARLGMKVLAAGSLSNLMSAALAGLFLRF